MGTMKYPKINAADVKHQARGLWEQILPAMGIIPDYLTRGKQCPCPMCGGEDRYMFDGGLAGKDGGTFSKYPDSVYYCRNCGAGSGIDLIKNLTDLDFKDSLRAVDKWLNGDATTTDHKATYARSATPKPAQKTNYSGRINALNNIRKYTSRTPTQWGANYLVSRGLASIAGMRIDNIQYGDVYYSVNRGYLSANGKPLSFGAMVGFMSYWNESGNGTNATQIYLEPEKIKPLTDEIEYEFKRKKLFARTCDEGLNGRAVWFSNKGAYTVHVGEGVETMLAVAMYKRTLSVAACCIASNLANFVIPAHVRSLVIWADKDRSKAGEKAALKLKERYANQCKVTILLPEGEIPEGKKGIDWLDVITG